MYKIEEPFLKLKNHKRFTFRPRCIHTGQKTGLKISCDSPFHHMREDAVQDQFCVIMRVECRQKSCAVRFSIFSIGTTLSCQYLVLQEHKERNSIVMQGFSPITALYPHKNRHCVYRCMQCGINMLTSVNYGVYKNYH